MPSTTPLAMYFTLFLFFPNGFPNRSGSANAITRAPMHNTSRTSPPTPVAAPSYGTTWLGWLWLSWLMTSPYLSPSTVARYRMPESSEGPRMTVGPSVGRYFFRIERLLLYELCSLHCVLKM